MGIFKKVINFIREVKEELKKVTWSSRQELLASTIVVITVTFIMAFFIGIIDIALSKVLSMIFK